MNQYELNRPHGQVFTLSGCGVPLFPSMATKHKGFPPVGEAPRNLVNLLGSSYSGKATEEIAGLLCNRCSLQASLRSLVGDLGPKEEGKARERYEETSWAGTAALSTSCMGKTHQAPCTLKETLGLPPEDNKKVIF